MKTINFILIIFTLIGFSSCDTSENSPPYGPKQLPFSLKIVDKDGNDLLSGHLESNEEDLVVTSPYILTGTCNQKTIQYEKIQYVPSREYIHIYTNLQVYHWKSDKRKGLLTFRLQLPTVFGDNRETIIDINWKVKQKIHWSGHAEILEVRINGVKVEGMPAIMVVDN